MRRRVLFAVSSFGLAACTSVLGDFSVDPVGSSSGLAPDSSAFDAPNGDASMTSDVVTGDADIDAKRPVPITVAANAIATCATVAYDQGTSTEKLVTYCWGAGSDPRGFLGAESTDPAVDGFSRPRLPNTTPPSYLAFDKLVANARGLAFIGRIGAGQPQPAASAFCWGSNGQAECGLVGGGITPPTVLASSNKALSVGSVAFAPYHGCLVSELKLYCWGRNEYCQARSGKLDSCNMASPKDPFVRTIEDQSNGVIGGNSDNPVNEFDQFAGGYDHSCVVYRKTGGGTTSVACWGRAQDGQTGQASATGVVTDFTSSPTDVGGTVSSAGFEGVELASGASHACAIVNKGKLQCWGKNDHGQAGPNRKSPAESGPIALPTALAGTLTRLALGGDVTCLVGSGGVGSSRALCFGDQAGPLGRAPADIAKDFAIVDGIKDIVQIAVGADHACAIARAEAEPTTAPHSLFCWGKNDRKQIDPTALAPTFPTAHRVPFPIAKP